MLSWSEISLLDDADADACAFASADMCREKFACDFVVLADAS
jgi:hypothetical protein